ncbi:hypothetical protein K432DRAFT_435096 [Lepidopterella palustris CBS 459.81]|uniref:tripeptidyl-peptidase II n=1 Tax=Lepidopterella palustris CBS 459.81 TaxID=1314670 RepID=A0A8E2E9T5_9PEZI|nr:hypothetical protein K432DRAFT_435096 [Lepidopterella palustris CBS 459.81]
MRFSPSIVALAILVTSAVASPISRSDFVIHEKRHSVPRLWTRGEKLDSSVVIPVRIALTQSNLESGYQFLEDVSHPSSKNYGKHWTPKEVIDKFKPSRETVTAVRTWLEEEGISRSRIRLSPGRNWLEFNATVGEAERLLRAEYHVYEHDQSGQPHVACTEYSVPAHVRRHIDFVTPTLHFDAKIKPRDANRLPRRGVVPAVKPGTGHDIGLTDGWKPKLGQDVNVQSLKPNLTACATATTLDCLRALYKFKGFRDGHKLAKGNSYGIVEYTPQAYVPSDLDEFMTKFRPGAVGVRPILDSIDGGVVQQESKSFGLNGESDLDLEYAIGLVYPQPVTLYQVGDLVEGASFNNFLDGIDGTYCGGDDPTQDGVYPDPYNVTGAYEGPEDCGTFAPTKVISTSYGYNEADLTPAYEMRQCNEYMKLGMMGVTVLYSSGDYGVAGNSGQCIDPTTGAYNNGTSGLFNPGFPATCPYVTAVGATQTKANANLAHLPAGTQPETACETVIYSGGGFSNVFPLPAYQAPAVTSWFKNNNVPYGADRFNNSGTTRGFPDVAANGANYVIAIDGKFSLVFGTSASSPTFGSIITLINDKLLSAGKPTVGFINPALYAHPDVLNDVVEGGNRGCGTPGFTAVKGWDPVTGLGTPDYGKMLKMFEGLAHGGYGGGYGN